MMLQMRVLVLWDLAYNGNEPMGRTLEVPKFRDQQSKKTEKLLNSCEVNEIERIKVVHNIKFQINCVS